MASSATERQIPLILLGSGLVLYAVGAFVHAGAETVPRILITVLIGAAIETALLIGAAYIVASMLSVSFGDFRSAMLKFAAATIASGALAAILPVGGLISAVVFLGLVMWLFELEVPYAIALAVIYFLLLFVVALILRIVLSG